MSQILIPNPEWTPQRAPVQGEPRSAESVELQDAADRTEFLKVGLDHIDPDRAGARRLNAVLLDVGLNGLAALTDYSHGEVRYMHGYGLYYLDSNVHPSMIQQRPMMVQPDNAGPEVQWVSQHFQIASPFGLPNGIARLNADGKVPKQMLVPAVSMFPPVTLPAASSQNLVPVDLATWDLSALDAGDRVLITAVASSETNSYWGVLFVKIEHDATVQTSPLFGFGQGSAALLYSFVVGAATTVRRATLQMTARTSFATSPAVLLADGTAIAQVFR